MCPCTSGDSYLHCCQPLHQRERVATSAAQLMRSRYCAYVMKEFEYIVDTYDASTRPRLEQIQQDSNTLWLTLKVLDAQSDDSFDYVTFDAWYAEKRQLYLLKEKSRFVFNGQQWFYLDGELSEQCGRIKLGNNERCFCGSGKKYKQCCQRKIKAS